MHMVMEGVQRMRALGGGSRGLRVQGGAGGQGRLSSQGAAQYESFPHRVSSVSSFYPRTPAGTTSNSKGNSFTFPEPTYSEWQPEKPEIAKSTASFTPSLSIPAQEDSYGSPLAPLITTISGDQEQTQSDDQFSSSATSSLWESSPPNSLPVVFPTSLSTSPPSLPSLLSTINPTFPSISDNLDFSVQVLTNNVHNEVTSSLEVDLTGEHGTKDDLPEIPPESSNIQIGPTVGPTTPSPSNSDPEIALAIKIVSPFVSPSGDKAADDGVPQQPSDPFPDQENPGKCKSSRLFILIIRSREIFHKRCECDR